jgi:Phosphatidylinositol-glycan biosynthesis class S protein
MANMETDLPEMKSSKREKNVLKQSEKEEIEEENARMLAAVAFAIVLIAVCFVLFAGSHHYLDFVCLNSQFGLPLWWKTTEVYRVSLPYDKINALQPQETQGLKVKIMILTIQQARGVQLCQDLDMVFRLSSM